MEVEKRNVGKAWHGIAARKIWRWLVTGYTVTPPYDSTSVWRFSITKNGANFEWQNKTLHGLQRSVQINDSRSFLPFFLISKPQCQVGSDLRSQRLGQHQDIAGLQTISSNDFMLNESSTGASPQDGPGVEDGLTSRDFGPSFFTSIVEAFNHFPGHDITMFFFHLRWDWENHQHRVNPVSADGVEIREGICTGNSALIVWIQGDRGKEICSTCQIDCLTLSSCGTDGYQRNIWRVFGQHSTVSDVVQPAGQFVLPNLETHWWGIPQLAGLFHENIQPNKWIKMWMIYDDWWWLMMIYDDLWWFILVWWFKMKFMMILGTPHHPHLTTSAFSFRKFGQNKVSWKT